MGYRELKPNINKYPNKVGLFCNARDEKNMKEWATHHLLIGFDIIIIFDHLSEQPLSREFLKFDPRVVIIRLDVNMLDIKTYLNNRATSIAKQYNMDWFLYLDADEFLILNHIANVRFKNIKHFLKTYSYADSIGINWVMFGSNYLVKEPTSGLLIENYNRSSLLLDKHVKSIVRTNKVKNADNPHYYHLFCSEKMMGVDLKKMSPPFCFNPLNMSFHEAPVYIAHYVYQSEESYFKRKIRLIADNGTIRENLGIKIHELYNDVVNEQPQKYVNDIKMFIDFWKNK